MGHQRDTPHSHRASPAESERSDHGPDQLELTIANTNVWFGPIRLRSQHPVILREDGFSFTVYLDTGQGIGDLICRVLCLNCTSYYFVLCIKLLIRCFVSMNRNSHEQYRVGLEDSIWLVPEPYVIFINNCVLTLLAF